MKANEKNLIRFLESSDTNFVIPVYQRNYDWKKEQCKQLYDDLVAMIRSGYKSHFFGTIVSIYNDSGRNREYLIIDGQQRTTTITLLLLAVYNYVSNNEVETTIIKEKIMNMYLINVFSNDETKIKLKPIQKDRVAFERLFMNEDLIEDSNITLNYNYFYERIQNNEISLDELYSAIERLMIVEIELKNGEDDPQLIFESLNSTGLDLNDGDKVRNFILMGRTAKKQEELYTKYWSKVEKNTQNKVVAFIRDYLTMKENKIPNLNKVYVSFKQYILQNEIDMESCLKEMLTFSGYYNMLLTNNTGIKEADGIIKRINKLEVTVAYPFFLGLLDDFKQGVISKDSFVEVLTVIESYVFRRIACRVATNALNKIFMNLEKEIKVNEDYKENYAEIVKYILLVKKSSQRYPKDDEFKRAFLETDFYTMNSKNKLYLLERLENFKNTEKVDVENLINSGSLTIEHIMPQKLNDSWKDSLGDNYQEIHDKYINTIGNLTLTGYNSSMSNKSFLEKRDMENGFSKSRLKLNKFLSTENEWNETTIIKRAELLYALALDIWPSVNTTYSKDADTENLFSLADDDDFTNTKVKKYIFMGDEVKVSNWTQLYDQICKILYDIDPAPFVRLTTKSFENEYLEKRFSKNEVGVRDALQIGKNVYVEKNLNTEAKLSTLRVIFDEYNLDHNELMFIIG